MFDYRKSFLLGLDIIDDDDPREKVMFYREYVDGFIKDNKNNDSEELSDRDLKSLMGVKLKMTQMLLEEFKYLEEAAHGCKEGTVLGVRGGEKVRSSIGKEEEEEAIEKSYTEEKVR